MPRRDWPELDLSIYAELRSLAERLDGPAAPAPIDVQDALERGFANLVALEARLQRELRESDADTEELRARIDSLRELLGRLRASTRTAPLALGFVRSPFAGA